MLMGKVIGNLWATRKCDSLQGLRLLIIEPLLAYQLSPDKGYIVVADNLGAGKGETVIIVFGEPARQICGDSDLPLEAAVLTIVDQVDLEVAIMQSQPIQGCDNLTTRAYDTMKQFQADLGK